MCLSGPDVCACTCRLSTWAWSCVFCRVLGDACIRASRVCFASMCTCDCCIHVGGVRVGATKGAVKSHNKLVGRSNHHFTLQWHVRNIKWLIWREKENHYIYTSRSLSYKPACLGCSLHKHRTTGLIPQLGEGNNVLRRRGRHRRGRKSTVGASQSGVTAVWADVASQPPF